MSEFPGEGKSFFTAVLAAGLAAFSGCRVLVIDAASHYPEKSMLLENTIEAMESIDLLKLSGWEGGHAGSGRLEPQIPQLIERFFQRFRAEGRRGAAMIDTCALTLRNRRNFDPLMLAKMADHSILVTSRLPHDARSGEKERLMRSGVKLMGAVHNGLGGI